MILKVVVGLAFRRQARQQMVEFEKSAFLFGYV